MTSALMGYDMITQSFLREIFDYKDGNLIWKIDRTNGVKANDIAGSKQKSGYVRISINNHPYSAHRLIFLWHHGHLPKAIDHIDRNRSNNRIENLREATATQNQGNRSLNKTNTSGYRGVGWHKKYCKWVARISINGKLKNLGQFSDIEDAKKAYCKAAMAHFGTFANV